MPRCAVCQEEVAAGIAACPRDGTPIAPSLVGKVLGERYRILRELGQGGMGQVLLAEHVLLGKQVAVKVLRRDFSSQEDLVKRFQLEAVAASQIGQENIVDVTDFGQTPDRSFYYVMEFVPGRSLAQLVDGGGPLAAPRALPLLAQICKALAAAHARGIVHRDLKPDNVIVSLMPDGTERAKVLDFGISKVGEGPKGNRITQAGMVVGTPHYMAPEQAVGSDVDLRVDVYAFGVLAYEVLTGKVPFDAETPVAVLLKHQSELPQPPSERAPAMAIPLALETLVLRCLEKRREARPQDMSEVLRAVEDCMVELGLTLGSAPLSAAVSGRTDPMGRPLPRPHERSTSISSPRPMLAPQAAAVPREPTGPLADPRFVDRRGQVVLALLVLAIVGGAVALAVASRPSTANLEVVVAAPRPAPALVAPPKPAAAAPAVAAVPVTARVLVSSVPAGARVIGADQRVLGQTPLALELARDEQRALRLEVQGYRPAARVVRADERKVEVRLERLPAVHVAKSTRGAAEVSSPADDGYRKVDRDDIRDPYGN